MASQLHNINLKATASGETWNGLTFRIDESDDTQFGSALSRVRMTWKPATGASVLTLDSNTSGQITITTATAYAWGFTVEPRILSLSSGIYSWSIETTDSTGVIDKNKISGTHQILPDPHA